MVVRIFNFIKKQFQKEFGFAMVLPAVLWQWIFLLIPTIFLFWKGFLSKNQLGLTFQNYELCFNWNYFAAILNSLKMAYLTALLCFLFCLPLVLVIQFWVKKRFRSMVLFFLMMPSWTNFILRIYSCFYLLSNDGVIFRFVKYLNLYQGDSLLTTSFVTYMVMIYCYFPFMLLPLYSAVGNINPKVLEASADLGASNWQTFWRVIIPISLRGIFFSFVMVVLSSFGEFSIPELIGGAKYVYWGNLVVNKILFLSDYYAGSAVMFFGIFCLLTSIGMFYFLTRLILWLLSFVIDIPEKVIKLQVTH